MERKFKNIVSMVCTWEQFTSDIEKGISCLGYKPFREEYVAEVVKRKMRSVQIGISPKCISWSEFEPFKVSKGITIEHYNPELFLALAACSQEPDFWPGEWLIVNDRGVDSPVVVYNAEEGKNYVSVKRAEEIKESGYFTLPKQVLRKATAEEIISHFTKEPSFFDQISGESDNLDYLTTESLTEIYNIAAEEKDQANTVRKKDVPLSEKVDKMVDDLNAMSDHADEVLRSLDNVAQKVKECDEALRQPPIGVMPRKIWDEKRLESLFQATMRYLESGQKIPREWYEEIEFILLSRTEDL